MVGVEAQGRARGRRIAKIRRAAVVLCVVVLAGCATLGARREMMTPEVSIADLSLIDAGLFEQRYRVRLRILNPNDFTLPIRGMRFAVDLNDKPFARGLAPDGVDVPRLGQAFVDVEVATSTFDLVRQALGARDARQLAYELEGTLFLSSRWHRELPFSKTGKLELASGDAGERFIPVPEP